MANGPWVIEPFDTKRHIREGFHCGVQTLDDWLAKSVSQYEKRGLARTYVLTRDSDPKVYGYYAISNHAVSYSALPAEQAKGLPRLNLPVVLLGRLAVDRSQQGNKLGALLLMDALLRVERLADKVGIRAVEVDAIDDAAKRFYLHYGFIALEDDPRHLYLPIQVIRKLQFD